MWVPRGRHCTERSRLRLVVGGADNVLAHSYQVVLCLAVGSFIRIFSFLEVNCVYEEVFRSLKDVFFVMAFVLVVLFWIELQTGMRAMKSIQRLRPYLIAVMVIYAIFRILASIADLFISGGVKNMFMGVCILIYGSIMALGLWFGVQLLGKMKTMKRSDIQARLQKLTRFIILENLVLVVFLFAYLIRTVVFKKAKEDDPWLWFYLKLIEKVCATAVFACPCTGNGSTLTRRDLPVQPGAGVFRHLHPMHDHDHQGEGEGEETRCSCESPPNVCGRFCTTQPR